MYRFQFVETTIYNTRVALAYVCVFICVALYWLTICELIITQPNTIDPTIVWLKTFLAETRVGLEINFDSNLIPLNHADQRVVSAQSVTQLHKTDYLIGKYTISNYSYNEPRFISRIWSYISPFSNGPKRYIQTHPMQEVEYNYTQLQQILTSEFFDFNMTDENLRLKVKRICVNTQCINENTDNYDTNRIKQINKNTVELAIYYAIHERQHHEELNYLKFLAPTLIGAIRYFTK